VTQFKKRISVKKIFSHEIVSEIFLRLNLESQNRVARHLSYDVILVLTQLFIVELQSCEFSHVQRKLRRVSHQCPTGLSVIARLIRELKSTCDLDFRLSLKTTTSSVDMTFLWGFA